MAKNRVVISLALIACIAAAIITADVTHAGKQTPGLQSYDQTTLATLGRSGTLLLLNTDDQGKFSHVETATLVHAPSAAIWKALHDPAVWTRRMPDIYKKSELAGTKGNGFRVRQSMLIKMSPLSYEPEWVIEYTETGGDSLQFKVVEGAMPKSFGSWKIIPVSNNECLLFLSIGFDMKALGKSAYVMLSASPDLAMPPHSSMARRMVTSIKWEAEEKSRGKFMPFEEFNPSSLDQKKLIEMFSQNLFLLRDKSPGSPGEAICGGIINAPIDRVWAMLLDFEHYSKNMPMLDAEVISRGKNEAVVNLTFSLKVAYIITQEIKLQYLYRWDAAKRWLHFEDSKKGMAASHGDYFLFSTANGKQTLVICVEYIAVEDAALKMPSPEPPSKTDMSVNQFSARTHVSILKVAMEGGEVELPPGMSP